LRVLGYSFLDLILVLGNSDRRSIYFKHTTKLDAAMLWICPQISCVGNLIPKFMLIVFGGRTFGRWWNQEGSASPNKFIHEGSMQLSLTYLLSFATRCPWHVMTLQEDPHQMLSRWWYQACGLPSPWNNHLNKHLFFINFTLSGIIL
jgi:hypothetical protein